VLKRRHSLVSIVRRCWRIRGALVGVHKVSRGVARVLGSSTCAACRTIGSSTTVPAIVSTAVAGGARVPVHWSSSIHRSSSSAIWSRRRRLIVSRGTSCTAHATIERTSNTRRHHRCRGESTVQIRRVNRWSRSACHVRVWRLLDSRCHLHVTAHEWRITLFKRCHLRQRPHPVLDTVRELLLVDNQIKGTSSVRSKLTKDDILGDS